MPRLPDGTAVRPERGQIVKLDSGFNLKSYTEALANAEYRAATLGTASVIKYWETLNSCADLRIDQDWMDMDGCRIVATVDHHGIITESKWVKEQIEKLGEVAA